MNIGNQTRVRLMENALQTFHYSLKNVSDSSLGYKQFLGGV